jgi:hypothetical protein
MGYVDGRRRAAGFVPHSFTQEAGVLDTTDDPYGNWKGLDDDWKVVRLELVSLLKHDPPAVYLSKNLPRMDELQGAPTRPLNGFEVNALPRLGSGDEDVVVEDLPGVVRMVGALRAGEDCLACHRGSRGDLLGAFSYELRPNRPVARPPGQKAEPQARTPRDSDRLWSLAFQSAVGSGGVTGVLDSAR